MTLPRFNSLIRLQTVILASVFLMLTACSAQQPITSDEEPVAHDPIIELPITSTSEVPPPSIVDSGPLEAPQVEPVQVEPVQVEPVQVEPVQVEPVQVEPVQVEPVQVAPAQVAPAQVAPEVKMASVTETSTPVSDLTTPAPKKAMPVAKKTVAVVKEAVPVAKKTAPVPLVSNQNPTDSVAFLLGAAGWAFEKDKLTTPKSESAYYYLSRVLAKEPQNPLVLVALEKIVQRYYTLLQASLNKDKVKQARVFWSRAKKVMPKHDGLTAMKALIDNHKVKQAMAVVPGPVTALPALRTQKLLLPVALIEQQDKQLAQWLMAVAKKSHDLQATMLIVAPKDTQARWVYQAMNSADPEQRIRANIKHSRPARVEISYLARKDELEVYGN